MKEWKKKRDAERAQEGGKKGHVAFGRIGLVTLGMLSAAQTRLGEAVSVVSTGDPSQENLLVQIVAMGLRHDAHRRLVCCHGLREIP